MTQSAAPARTWTVTSRRALDQSTETLIDGPTSDCSSNVNAMNDAISVFNSFDRIVSELFMVLAFYKRA
jgi:hypothetical protein